jgi:hypothetical protein
VSEHSHEKKTLGIANEEIVFLGIIVGTAGWVDFTFFTF